MISRPVMAIAFLVHMVAGCATTTSANDPKGRMATIHTRDREEWRGELLAASPESVWTLNGNRIDRFSVASVRRVDIPRHRLTGVATITTSTLVGAVVGLPLTVACNRYNATRPSEDSPASCGSVIPATALFFMLAGTVLAIPNHFSSHYRVKPGNTDKLRAFARFPQGLPDTISVARLLPRP